MINKNYHKWQGEVSEVVIGKKDTHNFVKIGGQKSLPFLFEEGKIPNRPVVALEIWDTAPSDWPEALNNYYQDVFRDTLRWAEKCVKEYKADLLCIKLQGAHPDFLNISIDEEVKLIRKLLDIINVPLIIIGCGYDIKDNELLPACCEVCKGNNFLIGEVTTDNYKSITLSALADGHSIIAQSPIDVNIAKQLNILISELGMPLERIVIDPTVGALGYGLEYAYSIMERIRLAALSGDKALASPFICFVGQEVWKVKETKENLKRAMLWELTTSIAFLQAGADILVMRHPQAVKEIKDYIDKLTQN